MRAFALVFLCIWGAAVLVLLASVAHADEYGYAINYDHVLHSTIPSGYQTPWSDPVQWRLSLDAYLRKGRFVAMVQPYMVANSVPAEAGLFAAAGVQFGSATLSVYHHSCHNLDRWTYAPACDENGIKLRYQIGASFAPLW